jgi:hypothetical protein
MSNSTPRLRKQQAATLSTLAKKANREHAACETAIRSALEHARQCGDALLAAKKIIPFGTFENWVTKNCKFSPRMARRYMTIANGWVKILDLSKRTRASELPLDSLSLREALRILSAGGPEEIKPEYLDRTCPSCGERLVVTSKRYATCPACWNCRLYSIVEGMPRHSYQTEGETNRSTIKSLGALEHLDPIYREQVILGILDGINPRTEKWLETYLHNTRREIELAEQRQSAEPAAAEVQG